MMPSAFPFDSLIEAISDPVLVLDLRQDLVLAANERARRLLEPGAEPWRMSAHLGRDLPRFVVFIDEVAYRGEAWTRDVRLRSGSGKFPRCELRGSLVRGDSPLLLLTLIDLDELGRRNQVTETAQLYRAGLKEWRHAQSFFAELEQQNQLILNAAGEGIYGVNADGKTTFVNRAAQEMLGWTSEDLLGRDIHNMIHHHHLSGEVYRPHDCPIYRSFRFEQVNRIEDEVFWRKDGRPIRVEYVSTPIYDQKILAGAVVIFRDITERKENERKLREALDEIAGLRDRLEQENAYLQEEIITERAHHDIIGTSPGIRQVLSKIELVARTEANVFLSGETGTGKALVASAIHKASDRRRRPLIHFKCGSVAPDELEAELFGQMRGAYAGALRDKPGKLELANGGTLFLDDVTEIPLEQQGKLLAALKKGEVTRMGATQIRPVDIRIIAASTRDIEAEVAAGNFREDFYFFLNVFPIECLPLRKRREDIPHLALHLLDLACKRLNRRKPVLTEATMKRLVAYDWPGNVAELRNVIERAAILSTGSKLIVEFEVKEGGTAPGGATPILTEAQMQSQIRANLVACLRETGGRVSGANGAAELLGVRPTTLYSRIQKFRIEPDEWR